MIPVGQQVGAAPRGGVGVTTVGQPSARAAFRADLARYVPERVPRAGLLEQLGIVARTEALWALALYRFGRWLQDEAPAFLRVALRLPFGAVQQLLRLAVGIHLDPDARIGPGLYIGHSGGIWVAPGTVIGTGCNLSQEVTLGVGGTIRRGSPVIEDRVWIGPKATVAGPVRIGRDAVVGANSLVVTDVPERGVALGVPARIIGHGGSGHLLGS